MFDNLTDLIQHYKKEADGLVTNLITAILAPTFDYKMEKYMINKNDLEIKESVGKGEFGEVHLGLYRGQKVAVKCLKDNNKANEFLKEAKFMISLDHENLVKLVGIVQESNILLISEYMDTGCVVDYLRSRGRTKIKKEQLLAFANDTCKAMQYLEQKKVVHRDLAARNVLLKEVAENNYIAKVADFGLARETDAHSSGGKFPVKWTAPEALKDHGKFTSKSDCWSFGIFLWELFSFGRVPYPRIPLNDVLEHVTKGYRMEPPDECPPEIHRIMSECWNLNPDKRPTFSDIHKKISSTKN